MMNDKEIDEEVKAVEKVMDRIHNMSNQDLANSPELLNSAIGVGQLRLTIVLVRQMQQLIRQTR